MSSLQLVAILAYSELGWTQIGVVQLLNELLPVYRTTHQGQKLISLKPHSLHNEATGGQRTTHAFFCKFFGRVKVGVGPETPVNDELGRYDSVDKP